MKRKKHHSYSDTDIAAFYAKEIEHVFSKLREVSPTITNRLDAKKPTWVAIETGGQETIRDYVLSLNNSTIADCPVSHILTSNKKTLEIDHFYPVDKFMAALDKLKNNQALLALIKSALQSSSEGDISDILIPSDTNGKLLVTRLKVLYYNYIGNLWAISGNVNSSKRNNNSFVYTSLNILSSLDNITSKQETINQIKQAIFEDLKLNWEEHRTHEGQKQGAKIGKTLNQAFNQKCPHQYYILPHYIENNQFIFMFDFFKKFEISRATLRLSEKIQQYSAASLQITNLIASAALSRNKPDYSTATALGLALFSFYRSARKSLGDDRYESPSKLMGSPLTPDTEKLKTLDTVLNDITNVRDKMFASYQKKRSSTEVLNHSNETENSKKLRVEESDAQENNSFHTNTRNHSSFFQQASDTIQPTNLSNCFG